MMGEPIEWPNLVDIHPPIEGERFKITHIELSEERVREDKLRAMMSFSYGEVAGLEPGVYTKLIDKDEGTIMMSNTYMEKVTNMEVVHRAHGDVLIAGLGLGLILLPIVAKEAVKSILVVEKYQEVYDLVWPRIKDLEGMEKVTVVIEDIDQYKPDRKFNIIYFDIWPDICDDNYPQMKTLHRRFARALDRSDEGAWMSSWRVNEFRRR